MERDDRDRPQAFYVMSEGPQASAVERGVRWLVDLGMTDSAKRSALLAVLAKSNLRGAISEALGDEVAKRLSTSETVAIDDIAITLMTKLTPKRSWNGPILTVFPTRDLLNVIDTMAGVTDVLVVPWNMKELAYWINAASAVEVDGRCGGGETAISVNANLLARLEAMMLGVNRGTPLANQQDRARIVSTIESLKREGLLKDAEVVRLCLVRDLRLKAGQADEVMEIAKGVLAGKKYRVR